MQSALDKFDKDLLKNRRSAELVCKTCQYITGGGVVGHAFTDYSCHNCGALGTFSNTDVPKLCRSCAIKLKACMRCGSNREGAE